MDAARRTDHASATIDVAPLQLDLVPAECALRIRILVMARSVGLAAWWLLSCPRRQVDVPHR